MSGSKGELVLNLYNVLPFRCRWLLAAFPSRALYLTVRGRKFETDCKNKILFYTINNWEPFKVFCTSETDQYESFFTQSWKPDPSRDDVQADLTFLEFIFGEPGHLKVNWVEVTRPRSRPCALECPELEACIGEDLACDGVQHCPVSGNDENPERCNQLPLLTIAISSSAAVAMVTLVVLGVVLRYRLAKSTSKTVIPPPEMYRTDCKPNAYSNKGPVR